MPGFFVFEGPDGVGKSTVAEAACQRLLGLGIECIVESFPGQEPGTLGALVYQLHHNPERLGVEAIAKASLQMLHVAAHVDCIERRIHPKIAQGCTVLLDRYWWSTWVYGKVSGVPQDQIEAMLAVEHIAWRGLVPSALFLLSRSPDRSVRKDLMDRYDELSRIDRHPHSIVRIDTGRPPDQTVSEVVEKILKEMGGLSASEPQRAPGERTEHLSNSGDRRSPPIARLHFSGLDPAVPSKVYDTYWKFAAKRQAIFFGRLRRDSSRLAVDPILEKYKFTNAYRASDRVSQFVIREVIYRGSQEPTEVFFRTVLFKLFNRIETWKLLERSLGTIAYQEYSFDLYDGILSRAMAEGNRIYSAAYIMPTAKAFGPDARKHRTHLRLLERMMTDEVPARILDGGSLRSGFELLRTYPMFGDFLAYQFTIDLAYSNLLNCSEGEFIVAGPGAKDGIRKCFVNAGGLSDSDLIRVVAERQQAEFDRLDIHFDSLFGRPLQLIDIQNLFCEVDKYARLAHPDVAGVTGRTRIKQLYRPTPNRIEYWYPPKWGINQAVAMAQSQAPSLSLEG